LTHSLEVSQIARTIGRALRLNEDLVEAIAIGHDVGHTPFGHAGEAALDAALQELTDEQLDGVPRKFRHYEQSLRIFDVLTPLNLSQEVRQGIDGHSKGKSDLSAHDGEAVSTLEAAVVRISDRIAYLNHDLDDAVRSGMIQTVPEQFSHLGADHGARIEAMVLDTIEQSLNNPAIKMSDGMLESMNSLKDWLFENVYEQYPRVYPEISKAKRLVRELLMYYLEPGTLPAGFVGARGALDYVAGMTDRFAVETYANLFIPSNFNERIGRIR
jgi:dGTPase